MLLAKLIDTFIALIWAVLRWLPPAPFDPRDWIPEAVRMGAVLMDLDRALPVHEFFALFGVFSAVFMALVVMKVIFKVLSFAAGAGSG